MTELKTSEGFTINWDTLLKVGTPLLALVAGYTLLQADVRSHAKDIQALQVRVEAYSATKERTTILETKFDNLLSQLEKLDASLAQLAQSYSRRMDGQNTSSFQRQDAEVGPPNAQRYQPARKR